MVPWMLPSVSPALLNCMSLGMTFFFSNCIAWRMGFSGTVKINYNIIKLCEVLGISWSLPEDPQAHSCLWAEWRWSVKEQTSHKKKLRFCQGISSPRCCSDWEHRLLHLCHFSMSLSLTSGGNWSLDRWLRGFHSWNRSRIPHGHHRHNERMFIFCFLSPFPGPLSTCEVYPAVQG